MPALWASIVCFPHPLIQGAVSGGGVGSGTAQEFGSYRSGAFILGGTGAMKLKEKTSTSPNPYPLPHPVCLPPYLPARSPLGLLFTTLYIPLG